jgi:tape measure domain-containing protein
MAKRDVELVIRARDNARKAIEGVSGALRDLTTQQNQVADSARRTDGLLGALGSELNRLNAEVQGLNALGKVANQLDRAAAAVTRLEGEFSQTADEVGRLSNELEQVSLDLVRLRINSDQAKESLSEQEQALRALTREQRTLDAQVDALKNGYSGLLAEFRKAKQPSDELRQSLRQQGIALQNALAEQERLTGSIRLQKAAVDQAKASFQGAQTAIRTAEGGQRRIAAAAETASAALQEQETALNGARQEFLEIRRVADTAATSLGNVAINQQELADASRQAAQDIRRVQEELRRQSTTPAAQPQATSQGGAAAATAAYRQQTQALAELEQQWTDAQARVKQLAIEMRNTAQPSQALRTEFLLAQAAAGQAKEAYLGQRLELEQLRRGIAATKAVAEGFAPVFQQAAAAQQASANSARNASNSFQVFLQRLLGIDRAAIDAGQAMRALDAQTRRTAAGVGTWGEETRKALSIGQRLRGEVLSLATAYLGLFQAINQVGAVVDAFRQAEAASNRLGAVFKQDTRLVSQELQFLTIQADRLGLGFGLLADEYSKFAIAASSAGLTITDTRDAFLSLAETARVNKLDTEQLSGVYLAFTQILSKGKFTSEEVRRQLGDRLPGAFNILADAIGVTGAELDRLLAAGELRSDADTLLKFTDELRKRFGGQLGASISSTTAELDRFKNTIFQAQLAIGRGGFIEGLTETVRELNAAFQTEEARQFFLSLGQLLGNGVRLLGAFVQNLDAVVRVAQVAFAIFVGKFLLESIRSLAQVNALSAGTVIAINQATTSFTALGLAVKGVALGAFNATMAALRGSLAGINGQLTFTSVRLAITSAALTTFRVVATAAATAARALWVAIGGFPGLIIAGATLLITELFGKMATQVPSATQVLEEHERQVQAVSKAYQQAKDQGTEFLEVLEGVSVIQAERTLRQLEDAYLSAFREVRAEAGRVSADLVALTGPLQQGSPQARAAAETLQNLVRDLREGRITARQFQAGIDELYLTLEDPTVKRVAQDLQDLGLRLLDAETKFGRQAAIAQQLGSTYGDLSDIIEKFDIDLGFLAGTADDVTGRLTDAARAAEEFGAAFRQLQEADPETKKSLERVAAEREINDAFRRGLDALNDDPNATLDQYRALSEARNLALDSLNKETDAYKEQERLRKQAIEDEKNRRKQIETTTNDLLFQLEQLERGERERAVVDALRSAGLSDDATGPGADNIRSLAGVLFDTEEAEEQKQILRELQLELNDILNVPVSREQFILNSAISAGIDLATEFGKEFGRLQGAIFDANAALAEQEAQQERLRDLIDETRNIETQRNNLVRELNQAIEDGNGAGAEALRAQIAETTANLIASRDAAIALATALGDVKALTALQKINVEYKEVEKSLITLGEFNRQFADGAARAFLSVGDAIGGLIDGTKSLGEGLRGVRDAFLSFASNFLSRIAEMILQQLIFNALQNSGIGGGSVNFLNALVRHSGGIAGGASGRMVPDWVFAGAMRYHTGGIAGLRPGEIPAVLQEGEEILTQDDPRHMFNGGGKGGGDIKIVNAIDPAEFISQGLSAATGERAILNFMRSNSAKVRGALGV